jgi:hypothetical protein
MSSNTPKPQAPKAPKATDAPKAPEGTDAPKATEGTSSVEVEAITTEKVYRETWHAEASQVADHYRNSVVSKDAATAYANAELRAAVTRGTEAMGKGDTDAALAAMSDSQVWANVVAEVSTATRKPKAKEVSVTDVASAIALRVVAMRNATYALARGHILPAEIEADKAEAYRVALQGALRTAVRAIDADTEAAAQARAYAGRKAIGGQSTDLNPHFRQIADRTPIGTVLTFSQLAKANTTVWPGGIPNGSGRIGARFINPKNGKAWPTGSESIPDGWVLHSTPALKGAARRVEFNAPKATEGTEGAQASEPTEGAQA